ncbi:RNA-directed DNA polymerase from mobile element jockey [Trichonephila clavipes]|nr:RNA-directed DNA polymerase from mobile element jockey [Trichonephila clavipes]
MATLPDCPVRWLKYGNPKTGQPKKSGEKWTSFIFALDPAATRRVRPCSYFLPHVLRKFWQRSRCPSIYSEFRTHSREIAKDIKSHSQTQWDKHIEALSPEVNTLWRKSSLLRKPFHSIPPPLKGALGSTAITPIEKAEVIADSLQEQFEPNHVADREEFDQRIHEEVVNFLATPHGQEIEPTTPTEILTYVQRIKPKKSPRT